MYIYGLTDEAGNVAYNYAGTFTTASTVDHTAADRDHLRRRTAQPT